MSEGMARPRHNYLLHLGLFLATCVTSTWAGIRNAHPEVGGLDFQAMWPLIPDGLPFSLSLMGLLLSHEMGHFILARYHGVDASLPYFLPVPLPMLGTMGAVIKMKGEIRNRNALVDIGASGPLAGLVVAVTVLAYGLHLSPVEPIMPGGLLEGNSVLYLTLKLLVKGAILPGGGLDVIIHPMALAGWVGLLVTMINLMPIGQLDGGHIAFALFGDSYTRYSSRIHGALPIMALLGSGYTIWELSLKRPLLDSFALGVSAGFPWLVWWLLLKVLKKFSGGQYHPPVGEEPLTPGRRRLCIIMMIIFFLILVPIPMRLTA